MLEIKIQHNSHYVVIDKIIYIFTHDIISLRNK